MILRDWLYLMEKQIIRPVVRQFFQGALAHALIGSYYPGQIAYKRKWCEICANCGFSYGYHSIVKHRCIVNTHGCAYFARDSHFRRLEDSIEERWLIAMFRLHGVTLL